MTTSRRKKRKQRRQDQKQRTEIMLPTPERLAKGNIYRLPSGQIKCAQVTFLDCIIEEKLFWDQPDRDQLHFALDFILNLTERSGLFSSATGNISESSFIRGGYNFDMSAADEWRHILKSLNHDAKRTMIDLLSDPRPRSSAFLRKQLSHFRELNQCVEVFRMCQFDLTKSKN